MIIVKKVAFWNSKEAFIEDRFKDGVNIIFSKENNRWKTLLMQSLMYSIWNQWIFPSWFSVENYYFYTNLSINNKEYSFLRKWNAIIVGLDNKIQEFNSIRDFKYYFSDNIYKLPNIIKDWLEMIVDPTIFYEIFFLWQDERNTTNIIVKWFHNKDDFLNMIYSIKNCSTDLSLIEDKNRLNDEKQSLELEIKNEKRKISILKENPVVASYVTQTWDNDEFLYISTTLKEINDKITDLRKQRAKEENRKINLENLLTELRSLNRQINQWSIICSDCWSKNIIYSNGEFKFDVTNDYVKNNILNSIDENIAIKVSLIKKYTEDIALEQYKIKNILNKDISPNIKNYILFDKEIKDIKDVDLQVTKLNLSLYEIKESIKNIDNKNLNNKKTQKELLRGIVDRMNSYYKKIDPNGKLEINDIFTKKWITYSWSEWQEYYFSRIMSLNDVLLHNFPIIIDSFREWEVSTSKEDLMINEFLNISNQVILTATLKHEEFNSDKYYKNNKINPIDYSNINDSKILDKKYVEEFIDILNKFNIKI